MASIRPIAVTMGEPAGVGAEIACKAWRQLSPAGPVFFVLDDPGRIAEADPACPVRIIASPAEAAGCFRTALPVLPLATPLVLRPGRPDPANSGAVIESIRRAVELALAGEVLALVTNPIQKGSLYAAGFAHPGHTEFLAALTGTPLSVMMIAAPDLRVVPVTIHMPLSSVPGALTPELIVDTVRIVAEGLRKDFRIAAPRIAVAGLNPHAGEDGSIGTEDREIIAPALDRLRAMGLDVRGTAAGRHDVPSARPGPLRRGGVHVPRPGPDPGQDAGFRPGRQRHARPADRAHVTRSRHRARHRGPGHRPARQFDRGHRARGRHGLEQGVRAARP